MQKGREFSLGEADVLTVEGRRKKEFTPKRLSRVATKIFKAVQVCEPLCSVCMLCICLLCRRTDARGGILARTYLRVLVRMCSVGEARKK